MNETMQHLFSIADWLREWGVWGLFLATAVEASSLPFPGAVVTMFYALVMEWTPWEVTLISLANSAVSTVFSLIPYYVGRHIHSLSKVKENVATQKARRWFRRYGDWGISLSRPTGLGNAMSYLAGIGGVPPVRFLLFSFVGAFPWNFLLLFVGSLGSIETIQSFLGASKTAGHMILSGIGVWLIVSLIRRRRAKKLRTRHEPSQNSPGKLECTVKPAVRASKEGTP